MGTLKPAVMANHANQLQNLDSIEEDLAESLSAAGQALKELSKDKPNVKGVETFTNTFMNRLDRAGSELSQQIAYLTRVTTGQSAEGSSYGCKKDTKLAKTRLEHAQARLRGLETATSIITRSASFSHGPHQQSDALLKNRDNLPIITWPECYNKSFKKIKRTIGFENSMATRFQKRRLRNKQKSE